MYDALIMILRQPQLVMNMHKINEGTSTADLKVFHSLKIRYLLKTIFFENDKMLALTALAILHQNLYIDRKQVEITGKYLKTKTCLIVDYLNF